MRDTIEMIVFSVYFHTAVVYEVSNGLEGYGIIGGLGSLVHLEKLEILEVPLMILLGYSPITTAGMVNLPPNLRRLRCGNHMAKWADCERTDLAVLEQFGEYLETGAAGKLEHIVLISRESSSLGPHICTRTSRQCATFEEYRVNGGPEPLMQPIDRSFMTSNLGTLICRTTPSTVRDE